MAQTQVVAPIFDQGNPFCAAFDPAIQPFVPNFNRRAGRRIRTLGVNQQLILKRIFIVPGRRPQKIRPEVRLIRHRASRAGSQFDDALQLGCHVAPPLQKRNLIGQADAFFRILGCNPNESDMLQELQITADGGRGKAHLPSQLFAGQ
ncbi:hypothetical protein [Paenibacillus sp. D9]|uniref:hypothetical protein n=1 Tax=Paenibacillus sp. D9 TaxID=665792 RepID=UPI000675E666|nr:hypothetical protein [Paenibacillus sp. D9]